MASQFVGVGASGGTLTVSRSLITGNGAGVLQQERALAATHRPGDALDPSKARRPAGLRRLQELGHAIARDVAGETLLDVDSGQRRALGRFVVR